MRKTGILGLTAALAMAITGCASPSQPHIDKAEAMQSIRESIPSLAHASDEQFDSLFKTSCRLVEAGHEAGLDNNQIIAFTYKNSGYGLDLATTAVVIATAIAIECPEFKDLTPDANN